MSAVAVTINGFFLNDVVLYRSTPLFD